MTSVPTEPVVPIIVVGMQRSGTKWLCNELASHPRVVCVQHPRHYGILETNMFTGMRDKFDLRNEEDYRGLIELWSETDFFRLAGGEKARFLALDPRPRSSPRLLSALMERLARRRGATHWLQKTSPLAAAEILDELSGARVVVIVRKVSGNLRSRLELTKSRGRPKKFSRLLALYALELRMLLELARRYSAPVVEFEALRMDREAVLADVLNRLGLQGDYDHPSTPPFRRNTSFKGRSYPESYFSAWQKLLMKVVPPLSKLVPLSLLEMAHRRFATRPRTLVNGTFACVRAGDFENESSPDRAGSD